MDLRVQPEILTSYIYIYIYIYMDLRLAKLKAIAFYLVQNVSTLYQCRKLSCVTVVCKRYASCQGYPNYRWDLTLSLPVSYIYIYGTPLKVRNFNVVYIWTYV
jgi:hypothetical protein